MNASTFILKAIKLGRGIAVATCSVNCCSKRSCVFDCMKSNVTCKFANRLIKIVITFIIYYRDLEWNDEEYFPDRKGHEEDDDEEDEDNDDNPLSNPLNNLSDPFI